MNMVPIDIVNWIERKRKLSSEDYVLYDKFQCLELLMGQSLSNFQLLNPSEIKENLVKAS